MRFVVVGGAGMHAWISRTCATKYSEAMTYEVGIKGACSSLPEHISSVHLCNLLSEALRTLVGLAKMERAWQDNPI